MTDTPETADTQDVEDGVESSADTSQLAAVLETDKGSMTIEFLDDKAPQTIANFLKLANDGFYDGLRFHRVIKDFMVQGGCPRGDGTGGPGWTVDAEFNDTPHVRGVVSMARSRHPNSAGSQFFVVHGENCPHLDGQYTAFARVVEGLDVLDALASVPTEIASSTGERSKPVEDVQLLRVTVQERAVDVADEDSADSTDSAESTDSTESTEEE